MVGLFSNVGLIVYLVVQSLIVGSLLMVLALVKVEKIKLSTLQSAALLLPVIGLILYMIRVCIEIMERMK